MITSHRTVYLRTTFFLILGACLNFVLVMYVRDAAPSPFLVGVVFSTMLQQAVLAAAWAALGPGHLLGRMIFTFVWAVLMGGAVEFGLVAFESGESAGGLFPIITTILWFVGQVPFWLVWCFTGLRLRDQRLITRAARRPMQFGIRELLIVTTSIATLLGLGRMIIALGWTPDVIELNGTEVIGLMVGGQLVASVPLVLAVFLPTRKQVVWGVAIALLVLAATTAAEMPLLQLASRTGVVTAEYWMFLWTNVLSIVWVVIFAAVVRSSGYHFGVPQAPVPVETLVAMEGDSPLMPRETIGSGSPAD